MEAEWAEDAGEEGLIDLIIIFWKLGDGDLSATNICPHEMRAFLFIFLGANYPFKFFYYLLTL